MIKRFYSKLIGVLVESSLRYTYTKLIVLLVLTLPAYFLLKQINIDTNLVNLLPESNRSFELNRELKGKIGDGGHFIVFFEGGEKQKLIKAVEETADSLKKFDEVQSVQYTYPRDFINKYKYSLIPTDYLKDLNDKILELEAEYNPFVDNLLGSFDDKQEKDRGTVEDEQDLKILLMQYYDLTKYHQSKDGRIFGMIIPTNHNITSIRTVRDLYKKIRSVTGEISDKYSLWTGIGGNHRNKLNEYDIIISDLNRSGIIASVLILLILILSFRKITSVLVVLLPLVFGLAWAFSTVPLLTGDLNLITSFLILILFGMGVDYSIHLLKRFQLEIQHKSLKEALFITYNSTGLSVVISAVTTAFALSLLAFSDFKGFSEFGIISSVSVIAVLLAMFLVLPPLIVMFHRFGFLKNLPFITKVHLLPNRIVTYSIIILTFASIYISAEYLGFDYNLANLEFDESAGINVEEIKEKHEKVYSISMSPAALYLANDTTALDNFLNKIENKKQKSDSTMIGRVRSLRDFAPKEKEAEERFEMIDEIELSVSGGWIKNIEDSAMVALIKDFEKWKKPSDLPGLRNIPKELTTRLKAKNGEGYLININPKKERKDGRNAMALTSDLYEIDHGKDVKGPVGETIIYAELLWLVISESWWIAGFTILGIFLIVWLIRKSIRHTIFVLIPLLAGLSLTMGVMTLMGLKLSFFNLVVIPALLGIGVDGGVHYIRKWKESGWKVVEAQKELFEPLSVATLTTMLGYSGMIFASHSGIRSIGIFACIGLVIILFTTLVLLPGILKYFAKKKE